jgi:hypothetical protein
VETRTAGSESGLGKRTDGNTGTAPRGRLNQLIPQGWVNPPTLNVRASNWLARDDP